MRVPLKVPCPCGQGDTWRGAGGLRLASSHPPLLHFKAMLTQSGECLPGSHLFSLCSLLVSSLPSSCLLRVHLSILHESVSFPKYSWVPATCQALQWVPGIDQMKERLHPIRKDLVEVQVSFGNDESKRSGALQCKHEQAVGT